MVLLWQCCEKPRGILTSVLKKKTKHSTFTDHVDPESPATYVAQSSTPDSYRAFITPEKPTIARKPPPEPKIAMVGTCAKIELLSERIAVARDKILFLV